MSIGNYKTIAISILGFLFCFGMQLHTASGQELLFQDGFEFADFRNWNYAGPSNNISIETDARFVRSGRYSLKLRYIISSGGEPHQDTNVAVEKTFSPGLERFVVSGYVYFGTPLSGGDTAAVQRKMFYLWGDRNKPLGGVDNWALILGAFGYQLNLGPVPPSDAAWKDGDSNASWDLFYLERNRWYHVSMEVKVNTPGQRDGYVNVWVDGVQVLSRTNMNLRGNLSMGMNYLMIGQQVNRHNSIPVDEVRYWDDIAIVAKPDTIPPTPPAGLRVK